MKSFNLASRINFNTLGKAILPAVFTVLISLSILPTSALANEEVNVYSYRQPFLAQPLFDAFEKETGIKVNMIFAKKGLIERAMQESQNSPLDIMLTPDIGNLIKAVDSGITQAVINDTLTANLPENLRDPKGHWYALTTRVRVAYASKANLTTGMPTSYEELADPKWKGRICTRSGSHAYNVALIAAMIVHHGEEGAKTWLKGLKNNLARKPQGNDRAQVKAVFEGQCDVALGNTYYMGKMQTNEKNPEQKDWASSVNVVFPTIGNTKGTHVNVSGMIMGKYAPNKDNAEKLMVFLTSKSAQELYAQTNFEYPARKDVPWSDLVKSWGTFEADTISLAHVAANRKRAVKMVNEVGYNQ
jgi:iron(III) transport system substrate-binding protein